MIDGIALKILVGAAVLCSLACAAAVFKPFFESEFCKFSRWFMSLGTFGKLVVSSGLVMCVMHGGSKNIIGKTGHDPEIGLVAAEYAGGGSVTNLVPDTMIDGFGHGTNISAYAFSVTNSVFAPSELAQKIWWREDNRNAWTNFSNTAALPSGVEMDSGWTINGSTTTVYYVFGPTNSWGHKQFYVGDNLPPVYIEAEGGIIFDSIVMTSRKATITYTVEAEALKGPGMVVFERMFIGGRWESVMSVEAEAGQHVITIPGFMVDRRSMWRLRLQVELAE